MPKPTQIVLTLDCPENARDVVEALEDHAASMRYIGATGTALAMDRLVDQINDQFGEDVRVMSDEEE